jgi:hypothetical protein
MSADLNSLIGSAPGGVLTLDPPGKEFQGPVTVRRPITIRGQGGTIWAERGPVLVIESAGVVLEHLNVEITGRDESATGEAASAIVARSSPPRMTQVAVRGHVLGIPGEEGEWRYPTAVRLGKVRAGVPHEFVVRLAVPVPCKIDSLVSGVTVSPTSLAAGVVDVTVRIDALAEGIRLRGPIRLVTHGLTRRIEFSGHLAADGPGVQTGTGQVVYEATACAAPPPAVPADDTIITLPPPPPPPPRSAAPPPPPPVAPPPPPPRTNPAVKSRYRVIGASPSPSSVFGTPAADPPSTPVAPASAPVSPLFIEPPEAVAPDPTPTPTPPVAPPPPPAGKKDGGMRKVNRLPGLFGGDPPSG